MLYLKTHQFFHFIFWKFYIFTFRSMIHFGFIFVKYVSSMSRLLLFFAYEWSIFSAPFKVKISLYKVKISLYQVKISLLHWTAFTPLSWISWLYLWGSIYGLSTLFHWSMCSSFHQNHTVFITTVYSKPWSRVVSVLQHCSLLLCWLF